MSEQSNWEKRNSSLFCLFQESGDQKDTIDYYYYYYYGYLYFGSIDLSQIVYEGCLCGFVFQLAVVYRIV